MGANKDQVAAQDSSKVVFDASAFMDQIFRAVDDLCGDFDSKPSEIIDNTMSLPPGQKAEGRLNCFYRMLGLPATRSTKSFKLSNSEEDTFDQYRTLNYFNESVLALDSETNLAEMLVKRQGLLNQKKSPSDFKTMITDPLPIDTAIDPANKQYRRVSLFPMVVDASIPVFPLNRRIAPLFYDGDFILSSESGKRLPRPFLETVLYIRTQVFSGKEQDARVVEIKKNLEAFVNTNLSKDKAAAFNSKIAKDAIAYNYVQVKIISKFISALSKAAAEYGQVQQKARDLAGKIDFNPAPNSTPGEKAGNTKSPIVNSETTTLPTLDARISDLNLKLEEINLINATLPTEKVKQADKIRRIDQGSGLSNVTDDIFVSEFSALIAFEKKDLEEQLQKETRERAKYMAQYEEVKKKIMYFTGEVTGLSVFDVLCIFLALFTLDISTLINLLNKQSLARLQENKFFASQTDPQNGNVSQQSAILADSPVVPSVVASRTALQKQVTEYFNLAKSFYDFSKENKR